MERKEVRNILTMVFVLALLIGFSGCVAPSPSVKTPSPTKEAKETMMTTVDAKSLFEEKCSICHSSERPKSKRKTYDEWEATVTRMKDVNGCPITDEEAKIIIDYLAKHYGK